MTDWSRHAHEADFGIRGEGPTPAAAFVGAALALTAAICDPTTVQPRARIDGATLRATAWGEAVDVARHQPAAEVKGATFTDLAVRETAPGHWVSQCIVDV